MKPAPRRTRLLTGPLAGGIVSKRVNVRSHTLEKRLRLSICDRRVERAVDEVLNVLLLASAEVVNDVDSPTVSEQALHEVEADEPRSAGHERVALASVHAVQSTALVEKSNSGRSRYLREVEHLQLIPGEILEGVEFSAIALTESMLLVFDAVADGDWVRVGECLSLREMRGWKGRIFTTIQGIPFNIRRMENGQARIGFLPIGG